MAANIKINLDALRTGREVVRHKIAKDGVNVFRMLPPTEKANGYPYHRWLVTWGMLDPVKGTRRPYASSLPTENKCPIHEYYNLLERKIKATELQLMTEGKSEQDVKLVLKPLNEILWAFRLKKVFVYNAANQEGKIGLLEVVPTAHAQIKKIMGSYYSEFNMDPTSLNNLPDDSGVWFKIEKTGDGLKTEYNVSINQTTTKDKVTGRIVHMDDNKALPQELVENYDKAAYDLAAVYQTLTYDELKDVLMINLKRIAKDCPEALVEGFDNVDAITERPATTASVKTYSSGTTNPNVKVNTAALTEEETPEIAEDDDYFAQAEKILNAKKQ